MVDWQPQVSNIAGLLTESSKKFINNNIGVRLRPFPKHPVIKLRSNLELIPDGIYGSSSTFCKNIWRQVIPFKIQVPSKTLRDRFQS